MEISLMAGPQQTHTIRAVAPAPDLRLARYDSELARLQSRIGLAVERWQARVETEIARLRSLAREHPGDPRSVRRLTAMSDQALSLLKDAENDRRFRGAKDLVRLEQLVDELVEVALVHCD